MSDISMKAMETSTLKNPDTKQLPLLLCDSNPRLANSRIGMIYQQPVEEHHFHSAAAEQFPRLINKTLSLYIKNPAIAHVNIGLTGVKCAERLGCVYKLGYREKETHNAH